MLIGISTGHDTKIWGCNHFDNRERLILTGWILEGVDCITQLGFISEFIDFTFSHNNNKCD